MTGNDELDSGPLLACEAGLQVGADEYIQRVVLPHDLSLYGAVIVCQEKENGSRRHVNSGEEMSKNTRRTGLGNSNK